MSPITDANGNEVSSKPEGGVEQGDARRLPTGTLIYNLFRVATREDGAAAFIMHKEAEMHATKTVGKSPELEMMYKELAMLERDRFTLAIALNSRFRDVDLAYAEKIGVSLYEPGDLSENPEEETSSN